MEKSNRKQLNIRLEEELYDFLMSYAKANYKSATAIIREIVAELYKKHKLPIVRNDGE